MKVIHLAKENADDIFLLKHFVLKLCFKFHWYVFVSKDINNLPAFIGWGYGLVPKRPLSEPRWRSSMKPCDVTRPQQVESYMTWNHRIRIQSNWTEWWEGTEYCSAKQCVFFLPLHLHVIWSHKYMLKMNTHINQLILTTKGIPYHQSVWLNKNWTPYEGQ